MEETIRHCILKDGKKIAAYSILLNLILAAGKGMIAIFSGSLAVMAETIHSLTDVLGSVAVWAGIRLSQKKSPDFPWGFYKIENIAAAVSAIFMLIMAYEVAKKALFQDTGTISHLHISVVILSLTALPIFLFGRYEKGKAAELHSPSLAADAQNWMTDLAPLGIVIAGMAGTAVYAHLDRVAAGVIVVFIVSASYRIIKDSLKSLLDASVDQATIEKIRGIIVAFEDVEEIVSLHARNSGSFIFVHLEIRLSMKKLKEAHDLSDSIEEAIRTEIPFVERVVIHYEPVRKSIVRCAVPLENREGHISEHFGSAPFIAVWEEKASRGPVISQDILENHFIHIEKGKGIKLAEYLVAKKVDILYLKSPFDGKGPAYVFANAETEIQTTKSKLLHDLIGQEKESSIP